MTYRVAFVCSGIKEKCRVIVHLHGKHVQGKVEMLLLRIDQMGAKIKIMLPAGKANFFEIKFT
jgi:hypothetical protein